MSQIRQHRFENGLVLLVEEMPAVASCAMTMLLPAGAATEPTDKQGVSTVLAELMLRGAGQLDARAHSDALDRLGVHRHTETQTAHLRLSATLMADRLDTALPLLLDTVTQPQLAESAFEPSRELALQAIDSLEDNPQEKVMIELKHHHHGQPMGRSSLGLPDHLESLTLADVHRFHRAAFVPGGAILGVAGRVSFNHLRDTIGQLLSDWRGSAIQPTPAPPPTRQYHHESLDSTQVHIGLAHDAPGPRDLRLAMLQRLAAGALSGGMSGRLFHEVREVRGLCYSVYAAYMQMAHTGTLYAYAGTTTQRADETLDVLLRELIRIADGISADEFQRTVVGLKSRLVMQGESTAARSGALVNDQYLLGAPRTLHEIAALIDTISLTDLNAFLQSHRPSAFTILTIGPQPLALPENFTASASAASSTSNSAK
jgi:predicted Zn-dependent peptidase